MLNAGQQQQKRRFISLTGLEQLASAVDMSDMDMSGMRMSPPPPSTNSSSAASTSAMSMGSGSENMMMMQMYFYASTKVTLWFHSWATSTRSE